MTIIPLSTVSLKNAAHMHGVGLTSAFKAGPKGKAALILESGIVVLTVKTSGRGGTTVDRTYMVPLAETLFVEPVDDVWPILSPPPVVERPKLAAR